MAKHCKEENMEIIDAPDAPGTNQNSLTVEQEREEKQDLREKVELQFRTLDSARRITPVMFIMCLVFGIAFSPAFLVDSFIKEAAEAESLSSKDFLDILPKDAADQWHWLFRASRVWMGGAIGTLTVSALCWALMTLSGCCKRSARAQTVRDRWRSEIEERLVGMTITELRDEYKVVRKEAQFAECRLVLFGIFPWIMWLVLMLTLPYTMRRFGFEARKLFGPAHVQ